MSQARVFEQKITVTTEHLDEMNHVNNVQYLQWVQDIAKAHWEHAAKPEWLEDYAWFAIDHFIEYKKPAFLGEELILKTQVKEFTGVKSHRLVRIYKAKNEQLVAQASTNWCMVNKVTQRPARIPKAMIEAYFEG